jgi:hypothetical protein
MTCANVATTKAQCKNTKDVQEVNRSAYAGHQEQVAIAETEIKVALAMADCIFFRTGWG